MCSTLITLSNAWKILICVSFSSCVFRYTYLNEHLGISVLYIMYISVIISANPNINHPRYLYTYIFMYRTSLRCILIIICTSTPPRKYISPGQTAFTRERNRAVLCSSVAHNIRRTMRYFICSYNIIYRCI